MGGAVRDRWGRHELEGLQTLGDLAGELIVALGTVLRSERRSDEEREALATARELFELMTSHDVIAVGTVANRMLGGERSYLHAVRAVEREANGSGVEEQARSYAETLRAVLDEKELSGPERHKLETDVKALRSFFIHMSESVLSRAGELSRTSKESPWRSTPKPTSNS